MDLSRMSYVSLWANDTQAFLPMLRQNRHLVAYRAFTDPLGGHHALVKLRQPMTWAEIEAVFPLTTPGYPLQQQVRMSFESPIAVHGDFTELLQQ